MKRLLRVAFTLSAASLALSACSDRPVSEPTAVPRELRVHALQLPACDFNNIFHTGDACPADADGNGRVEGSELPNPRSDAETPNCVGNVF